MSNPPNPYGSCFDATAHNFLANVAAPGLRVCHGVCVANLPGQEGWTIGHAWLEFDHEGRRAALDCIHLQFFDAHAYRKNLRASLIIEYTPKRFLHLWKRHDNPGPWDPRVLAVVLENTFFPVAA